MTEAKIEFNGSVYVVSERSVKKLEGTGNDNSTFIDNIIDLYHFSHTSVIKTLLRMQEDDVMDFEILEDLGGVPDSSFNDGFEE
ncbi:MAG: hypothetical protein NE330_23845 [Lentisphaeraceae bacterium]|nr:hypothetical protein [Lentisphaeraceae bacterium]